MKALKITASLLSIVSSALAAAIYCTEKFTDYIFLAGEVNSDYALSALIAIAAVSVIVYSVISIVSKRNKSAFLKTVVCLSASCAAIYYAFVLSLLTPSCDYYEFTSPDKQYTVIANEWSYLMGGGISFYERINPLFVKSKGHLTVDDGVSIINTGDYSVAWQRNVMFFTAENENPQNKTVTVELSK